MIKFWSIFDSWFGAGSNTVESNTMALTENLILEEQEGTLYAEFNNITSLDQVKNRWFEVASSMELISGVIWENTGVPTQSDLGDEYDWIIFEESGSLKIAINYQTHDPGDVISIDYSKLI